MGLVDAVLMIGAVALACGAAGSLAGHLLAREWEIHDANSEERRQVRLTYGRGYLLAMFLRHGSFGT